MKKLIFLLLSTLFIGTFVACESDYIDDRPLFILRTKANQNEQGDILVPPEGGRYRVRSLRYPSFEFSPTQPFIIDGKKPVDSITERQGVYEVTLEWDWVLANASGNILTVTLSPNTSGKPRHLSVQVQSHGQPDVITFLQAGE